MNDVSNIQEIINRLKFDMSTGQSLREVDFEWYGTTVPLVIPGKVKGEWHLQTANKRNGSWQLCYCYHSPKMRWCIIVSVRCPPGSWAELADTRYLNREDAEAEAVNLNRGNAAFCTTNRFKVQEIPV